MPFFIKIAANQNSLLMKKFFIPALAALFIVGMTSCKKDWTCTCTIAGTTTSTTIPDSNKSDATDACDALSTTASILGGSCSLD
jgi:hypothetical protein